LHPLDYHRPDESILHVAGSAVDLRSCSTTLGFVEVAFMIASHTMHSLGVEEEAIALSTWAVACICGSLSLEFVRLCLNFLF
ncbi:hypothetical protein CFOL_v3_36382, partial [Cephalotus follicularis]